MSRPWGQANAFDAIAASMHSSHENTWALYQEMRLHSVFQAIYRVSDCCVAGYEGLLRAYDNAGNPFALRQVFDTPRDEPDIVHLDRLLRALHMRNFCDQQPGDARLFLNVDPRVIVHGKHYGSFFGDLLDCFQMPAAQVVVEIIESVTEDEALLSESVQFYKQLGCIVAIDDFGIGHSNFDRVFRLAPDIVKLDRSLIAQAVDKAMVRRLLSGIVSLIHEAGSVAVVEGIETREQARIAIDTGADLVQGFYFAMPEPRLKAERHVIEINELLLHSESMQQDVLLHA